MGISRHRFQPHHWRVKYHLLPLPLSRRYNNDVKRLTNVELALFLVPILFVPAALTGRRWVASNAPKPVPTATPIPTPAPNLYRWYDGQIVSILPSPDGKVVHTGEQLGRQKFHTWDALSGSLIRRFGKFRYGNGDGALSPNGKLLAFGHGGWHGDRVVLLDTATGKEKSKVKKPRAVNGSGFDLNDEVVALPANNEIRLYRIDNGGFLRGLRHRRRSTYPTLPRFSNDGRRLLWIGDTVADNAGYASGQANAEIVWLDWKRVMQQHSIQFPQTSISYARFSGDGKIILATGIRHYRVNGRTGKTDIAADSRLFAIDASTGRKIYSKSTNAYANEIAVSPDGKWFTHPGRGVAPGEPESYLGIYHVATGKASYLLHSWNIASAAWSPDSKTLYLDENPVWRLNLQANGSWKLNKGQQLF